MSSSDELDTGTVKPKPKFRFRFSLASLIILMTLAAIGVWYWLTIAEPIKRQWRSLEIIQGEFTDPQRASIETSPSGIPDWLKWLFEEGKSDNIELLYWTETIQDPKKVDKAVLALRDLVQLEQLILIEAGITDQHVDEISKLTSLKELELRGNAITDRGAKKLIAMPNLELLGLDRNPLTWRSTAFQEETKPDLDFMMDRIEVVVTDGSEEFEQMSRLGLDLDSIVLREASVEQIRSSFRDQNRIQVGVRLEPNEHFDFTAEDLVEFIEDESTCVIQFNGWVDPKELSRIFAAVSPRAGHLFISKRKVETEDGRDSSTEIEKGLTPGENYWDLKFHKIDNQSKQIRVQLIGCDLSPQDVAEVSGLDAIELLSIYSRGSDSVLGLVSGMPNLKSLSTPVWDMSEEAATELANIKTISKLWLWGNADLRTINLSFLESPSFSSKLESLEISYTDINREQLLPVLQYPNLKSLKMNEKAFGGLESNSKEMLDKLREEFGVSPNR